MRTGALTAGLMLASAAVAQEAPAPYAVDGDAITRALADRQGDAARGAALMGDRHKSLCVLCHSGPFAPSHMQGDLGPDLQDVGARLSPAQIRLRIVDMKVINAASIMPAYYRAGDAPRMSAAWHGKAILSAQEIEDLVAYLSGLKG